MQVSLRRAFFLFNPLKPGVQVVSDIRVLDDGPEAVHGHAVRQQGPADAAPVGEVVDISTLPGGSSVLGWYALALLD